MHVKRMAIIALIATVVATMVIVTVASAHPGGASSAREESGIPRYQHIFVIMLENHSFDETFNNPATPAINALANKYGLATNYFGATHPSEPNYVASIAGSFFGIQDDASYTTHTITSPSVADQLDAKNLTWKTYQQALPFAGFTGTTFPSSSIALYASKHNPFINFATVQSNPSLLDRMVPDTQLEADLATGDVPNFGYIVPDQCHDMHGIGGGVCSDPTSLFSSADAYVNATVTALTHAEFWDHGNNAIVVTWDEDDFSATNLGCCDANPGGGHVETIVITNHGPRHTTDSTAFNHYSLLATIQKAFGLGCLNNTCDTANVKPMTKLFANGDD
jgi:phosphatidylinositol-3-phosphatase